MRMTRLRWLFSIALLVVLSSLLSACAQPGDAGSDHGLNMADLEDFPVEIQSAPVAVREAYQFAVANPDTLQNIPCYCGCGAMGHASNYACYVSGSNSDGSPIYDNHALGCSICVDITQDTMRLLKQGKTIPEMRTYIDETYASFGPSNMP